jgi:hypothetical protein
MNEMDQRPSVWVGHVVLETDRMEESSAFMVKLGMRAIFLGADISILELRGGTHLIVMRKSEVTAGAAAFDLMVDDLHEAHRRFASLGLEPSEIESMPNISHEVFKIKEPAGHVISVFSSHVEGRAV